MPSVLITAKNSPWPSPSMKKKWVVEKGPRRKRLSRPPHQTPYHVFLQRNGNMAKQKSAWFCQECGHKQVKWSGQCSQCTTWNTFQEEIEVVSLGTRFEAQ